MHVKKINKLSKVKEYNKLSEMTNGFSKGGGQGNLRFAVAVQDLGKVYNKIFGYSFVITIEIPYYYLKSNIAINSEHVMGDIMQRKDIINIGVSVDNIELTPAQLKVKYTEIKAFPRKKFYEKFMGPEAGHHGYVVLENNDIIAFDVEVIRAAKEGTL